MKHFIKSILFLSLICLTSLSGKSQILADTLKRSFQKHFAPVFKDKKVKQVSYSYWFPQLDSISVNNQGKVISTWTSDTLNVSDYYDKNGYFVTKSETFTNGQLYKKTDYIYDDLGNLIRQVETDSSRFRSFEYLLQVFNYQNGQIKSITKTKHYLGNIIQSTATFYYSHDRLTQVIELSDHGDLLMSSLFIYPISKTYVKEEHLEERDSCEVRSTYYYTFDKLGRINRVYGIYNNFKNRKKPIKKFSYDFVKEAFIFKTGLKKIERYN